MLSNNVVLSTTPILVEPTQYRVRQEWESDSTEVLVHTGVRLTFVMLVVTLSEQAADELRLALYAARNLYRTTTVDPKDGVARKDVDFNSLRIVPA